MNDLTILIPSQLKKKNYKTINFILNKFNNTKILIVSHREFKVKNNVRFLKIKKKDLISKIICGLREVKTKNILLLPDDEFPIVNSIIDIYSDFKKNTNISTGIGIKFYFDHTNPRIFFPINHHSFEYYNSRNQDNKKIENSLKFYSECFWCFHRTELLKKFLKDLKKNNFYDLFFMEYKIILFMKIFGKIKYYKNPWSFRIKTFKKWPTVSELVNLDNYKNTFKVAFDSLANHYFKAQNIKSDKKSLFYEAFKNFIVTPRPQDILKNLKGFAKLIFIIKKKFYKFFFQKKYYNLPQFVDRYYIYYVNKNNFFKIYSKKYINDYIEIVNFVLKNNILKICR
jgi:hypothetical protein